MNIIDPGHKYGIEFEGFAGDKREAVIEFVKKKGSGDGQLEIVQTGVTTEAVLEVLIDRLQYLQSQVPSDFTEKAIGHLQLAMTALEERTKDRTERGVEGTNAE